MHRSTLSQTTNKIIYKKLQGTNQDRIMKRICAAVVSEYDCELPYTIYEYDLSPLTTDAGVFDILDTVEDCLWMMYQSKNVHVISQMTLTALMKTYE